MALPIGICMGGLTGADEVEEADPEALPAQRLAVVVPVLVNDPNNCVPVEIIPARVAAPGATPLP